MCLNSRGENDNGQIFFKNFLEGGENDKGGKMTEGIMVFIVYILNNKYFLILSKIIIFHNPCKILIFNILNTNNKQMFYPKCSTSKPITIISISFPYYPFPYITSQ